MTVSGSITDEQTSVQARIVVSLSYVQTLRREVEAGRVSMTMLYDYLERLEEHLRKVERSPAIASGEYDSDTGNSDVVVDDILLWEQIARN